MSTTLLEVKGTLRTKVGRGTSLDASLHGYLCAAIKHIERKKNFGYMFHVVEVKTLVDAKFPRTLRCAKSVRDIDYMRLTRDAGEALAEVYPVKKSRTIQSWAPPENGYPTRYCLVQDNLIQINNTPERIYTLELGWWEYTSLATGDATEHWLFDNAREIVERLALHYAADSQRDFDRSAKLLALASRELDDFIAAEEDRDLQDQEFVMETDFFEGYRNV